ncbi:AT-RICH INTERACTIVE DOMAIN-CONTAINING PROTEIN 1 [Salix purpurea]|uniref:AT-RICH INTERACTIVE DOMAIN-CONTAINING PROTEIN 1 n=1 Tax=Salix purpurea TaxID=77065 RepID=A0A9Q0P187_SALPP|nr:AT-RICH INTERACTIVE DOMAIN-CONTAINING PROTEIN 1 [Salix purpurea]KAJ6679705.1 AT-RICH INTERACTIVE DOMAIN-CONTAINING PROTEIN 1 [Salix purpurea]KAJ6679706.1 AT-RICH INTERACTIVE DOMAIN-CONTAINING PROTEIN 1 [Salix purpurea]
MLGNGQFVDLLNLFLAVREKGGCAAVSENGSWDLVVQESGFGLNLAPSVKLVYIKYLDSLERWLERLLGDGIGLNPKLRDRGVNLGGALMELGAEFKGLLSEMPGNEFLDLNSELNVNAEVESYGSEKFTEDEESLHIDSTKSGVDFLEVGGSGDNVVKSFMMNDSFSNEHVNGMDVDANLIIDSRKSEKVKNDDEVKSVVVVETDGDEEGNNGDKSEVVELDLATFEESVSRHKRKRDSIYRMLNWVTGIAKDPCDPVVGSLPEWSKWKTYGNEECWKQVLVTREALFLKRNADSTSSAEGFVKQRNQKMHPCMYDDHAGPSYNFRERLKCRKKLFPGETLSQARVCSQSSSAATQTDSDSCMEGVYDGDSSTECSVLDLPITKRIPVGPVFQAEVPEWTGRTSESDSKWLGTRVWPLETSINRFVIEREPIGKGRSDACGCQVPKSIKCVRFHINERRLRVMREMGKAFDQWRFDKMGEEVKLSWAVDEQKKFGAIVRSNPLSLDKCFWDEICRCFPSKRREDLVSYYYNVFLLQRRANQNRSTPDSINSDDDESESELENNGSRRETVNSPGSLLSAKKQHKYVK